MQQYLRPKPAGSVILVTDDGFSVIQSINDDDDSPMVEAPRSALAMPTPTALSHFDSGTHPVPELLAAAPTPDRASRKCKRPRLRQRSVNAVALSFEPPTSNGCT
jgi:hypothetical protein